MAPRSLAGLDEPFPDVPVQPNGYSQEQASQAAGYIKIKKRGSEYVKIGPRDTQRFTLLLLTSKHVLEWEEEPLEMVYEARVELQEPRQRLKEEYSIEITMPANAAWHWISSDTQFEFFADGNRHHDIALIAIECVEGLPLPLPTIMPDINNVVVRDSIRGTNFYGFVFRPRDDGSIFQDSVEFSTLSVEVGDSLHHALETVMGDSGGMLYCYGNDPNKLVPVCVITGGWMGWDHNIIYNVNQAGAAQTLWNRITQILEGRDRRRRYALF